MQDKPAKSILIVDDQAITRELLARHLRRFGYRTAEAHDGQQAVAQARQCGFDSILLDLNMPGIDGIETCRRIRAIEAHAHTPVLIVTAREENEALSAAFDAGCSDFIVKPVNPVVLRARLNAHIQRTELYYQLERVRKTLNRYVSPRTQQMVEQYALSGHYPMPVKQDVCVLFTDIRGFTQLSRQVEATALFNMLSDHLAYQVELVYRYQGYVDKYAGDGIMAVFEDEDKARHACDCARDIIDHALELAGNAHNEPFAVGCGIHRGEAVIGNIGSPEHLDYSVVGETVNLAARLCGHAEPMSVVISSSVYHDLDGASQLRFSAPEDVAIKGFDTAIRTYRLENARRSRA